MKDITKVIMNPVRQRIAQYLMIHGEGTASDIAAELCDVSQASLYRHINILYEAGLIEISEEKKIRGTVRKTYRLCKNPLGEAPTNKEISFLIQRTLLEISASFIEYFKDETADPQKDMLSVTSSTLMLSDSELGEMLGKIGNVISEYIYNKPAADRRQREIAFVCQPPKK